MTAYFDPESEDLKLIPEGMRKGSNLALYATEAEADLLNHYTKRFEIPRLLAFTDGIVAVSGYQVMSLDGIFTDLGDGRGTYLRDYTVSAASCTNSALVTAMKRTIARVIVWRLTQDTRDLATTNESKVGSTSRTYRADHDAPFPRDWDRDLRSFDTRIPAWGI